MILRSGPSLIQPKNVFRLHLRSSRGGGAREVISLFLWIISFVLIWLILYCLSFFPPYGQSFPYKFCLSLFLSTVYELWVCQNARKFRLSFSINVCDPKKEVFCFCNLRTYNQEFRRKYIFWGLTYLNVTAFVVISSLSVFLKNSVSYMF